MNIILIGYRGSGKTSIGKRLASNLWLDFVDADALLTERAGMTIKEIFEQEGEAGFREREAAIIKEIAARDQQVIAVGGGAVLRPENVAALKANGKVIWLKASAKTLFERIQADPATSAMRPNLTTGGSAGGLEEVEALLEQRMPLYAAAADGSLDVTYLSIEDAAVRLAGLV